MQIKSAIFKLSARNLESCPEWERREFAFIGRSNVGKSSMVNMLTNKEGLAKVSATPGKTQHLNFFIINSDWSLVDLPGYGYAKVAKSEKIDFNESVGDYIEGRENLRLLFVLIDSRLEPQPIDLSFISWLGGCGIPFALVFTKADKQSAAKTQANIAVFMGKVADLIPIIPPVITSSSKSRSGRIEILKTIEHHLSQY